MIRKRYIFGLLFVLAIGVIIAGAVGYVLLSSTGSDALAMSGPTARGVPNGPATTKTIGPAGGSIASSDGRITVTVPPNELSAPVEFIVTPITNQSPGGFGNAYRLEPNGQKFSTPVEISFKYAEQELEGTIPEALMASYQEEAGGWRMLTNQRVDEDGRSLTVPTTHFTDMSLGRKYASTSADEWDPATHPTEALVASHFRVSPARATIHPGESVRLDFVGCENETVLAWSERMLKRWDLQTAEYRCFLNGVGYVWNDFSVGHGLGSVYPDFGPHVLYTAPSKKPTPNVVRVYSGVMFNVGKTRTPKVNEFQAFWHYHVVVEGAEITIIDRGYKATGNAGDAQYSGVVCLDSPFTINADVKIINFALDFTPGNDTGGTWKMSGSMPFLRGSGKGSYTFEDGTSEHPPRLALTGTSTGTIPVGSITKAAHTYIGLIPNDGNECVPKGE